MREGRVRWGGKRGVHTTKAKERESVSSGDADADAGVDAVLDDCPPPWLFCSRMAWIMDSQAWPHDSVTGAQNSSPQTAQRREASSALAGDRGPQSSGWVMPPTSASMLVFCS